MSTDDSLGTMEKDGPIRKPREGDRKKRYDEWWAARMRPIVPGLFIGNVKGSHTTKMLKTNCITAMVSLTTAPWAQWGSPGRRACVPEDRHRWVQCADSSTQDLLVYMSDICDFIERCASETLSASTCLPVEQNQTDKSNGASCDVPVPSVLVHCDLGISRSSTVIIAYLMRKYKIKREEALQFVLTKQKVRPSVNFTRQLDIWHEVGYQVWETGEVGEARVPKAPYQVYLYDRAALLKQKGLTGDEPLAPLALDEPLAPLTLG